MSGSSFKALSDRTTEYETPAASRTFDSTVGGDGFVPAAAGHYIENTGTEDLIFLDVLQVPEFNDIRIAQWLVLTPSNWSRIICIFPIQSLMF